MSIKDRMEEWWITSEFTLSKNQLIASIALAVLILGGWLVYYFGQSSTEAPIKVAKTTAKSKEPSHKVYVHVAGAVKKPGVYQLDEGSRVIEAIKKAGGFIKGANQDSLNLAAKVSDSQKIIVEAKSDAIAGTPTTSGMPTETKINLNTATEQQLDELPGIGEVMAKRILEYRTEIGSFKSVDQLKDIEGIGPKKFEKIKNKVSL